MRKFLNFMISISLIAPSVSMAGQVSLTESVEKGITSITNEVKKDEIKREIVTLFKQTGELNAKISIVKKEAEYRIKNNVSVRSVDPSGRTLKELGEGGAIVSAATMAFGLLLRSKGMMTTSLVILGIGAASFLGGMAQDENVAYANRVAAMNYPEINQELKNLEIQLSEISSKIEGAQRELYAL